MMFYTSPRFPGSIERIKHEPIMGTEVSPRLKKRGVKIAAVHSGSVVPAKSALQRCLEAIDALRIKEQARGELRGSINDPRHVGYYANKMAVQRGETGGGL